MGDIIWFMVHAAFGIYFTEVAANERNKAWLRVLAGLVGVLNLAQAMVQIVEWVR